MPLSCTNGETNMMTNLPAMDAIRIAMEAEQKAQQFYPDAKEKISDVEAWI